MKSAQSRITDAADSHYRVYTLSPLWTSVRENLDVNIAVLATCAYLVELVR